MFGHIIFAHISQFFRLRRPSGGSPSATDAGPLWLMPCTTPNTIIRRTYRIERRYVVGGCRHLTGFATTTEHWLFNVSKIIRIFYATCCCVCSSHQTVLSTRRHPAQKEGVLATCVPVPDASFGKFGTRNKNALGIDTYPYRRYPCWDNVGGSCFLYTDLLVVEMLLLRLRSRNCQLFFYKIYFEVIIWRESVKK